MRFPGTSSNAPEKLGVPWVGHSPSVPFRGPVPGLISGACQGAAVGEGPFLRTGQWGLISFNETCAAQANLGAQTQGAPGVGAGITALHWDLVVAHTRPALWPPWLQASGVCYPIPGPGKLTW